MSKSIKSKKSSGNSSKEKSVAKKNSKKVKRGPGRPTGAKNKTAPADSTPEISNATVKRRPGRPPGAKNKVKKTDSTTTPVLDQNSNQLKRGPGRPRNNDRRARKRNTLSNVPQINDRQPSNDNKRGPGRPIGTNSRNRTGFPAGYSVMGSTLLINLDEADINSVYYSSSSNKTLKCSPLE